jgi:hypothetical protein
VTCSHVVGVVGDIDGDAVITAAVGVNVHVFVAIPPLALSVTVKRTVCSEVVPNVWVRVEDVVVDRLPSHVHV